MMDIISQIKTADMILKTFRGDLRHMTPYPFKPEKKRYPADKEQKSLPRSAPEEQGVPSGYLERFFRELDGCRDISVHSVVVLRHGRLIAQAHWKPYTGDYAQMVYSLSKSVTAMAVGMAVEEGLFSLSDNLAELFSDRLPPFHSAKLGSVTVKNLLNMSSGIRFNEAGTVTERDWLRACLQSDCSFEPGTEFLYNSLNSYLLSALVCKKSGMGLVEYLTPRLFEPLGIDPVLWEKCPMGIEKGGWGLYLRPEDMAKLGQLYLQKGLWAVDGEPRRLLAQSWVEQSTDMTLQTAMGSHKTAYGYHVWDFPIEGAYQFNGVFGQYVVVIPGADMVLALTSGSQGLFIDATAPIIRNYFGDDRELSQKALPENRKAYCSLTETCASFALLPGMMPEKPPSPSFWQRVRGFFFPAPKRDTALHPGAAALNGKTFLLENAYGTLFPFILSAERGRFSEPFRKVSLSFEPGCCSLVFAAEKETWTVRAGMDGEPRLCDLDFGGEIYTVGSLAKLTHDEDGRTVLKLSISFLEAPDTRLMKFIFGGERVLIRFDEIPSVDGATSLLFGLIGGNGGLEKMVADKIEQQRLSGSIRKIVTPKAKGEAEKT